MIKTPEYFKFKRYVLKICDYNISNGIWYPSTAQQWKTEMLTGFYTYTPEQIAEFFIDTDNFFKENYYEA
jgi:hypothetical protein